MVSVNSRFAPAIVFAVGAAFAAALLAFDEQPTYDGLNHYDAQGAVAAFVYAVAAAVATGWAAVRARTGARCMTAPFALLWGLIAGALFFDLAWLVVGPGVEPMPDRCLGGMDCIGEKLPGAPLTGDGWIIVLLGVLSTPFVALVLLTAAFSVRAEPRTDRARTQR